MAEPQPGRHAGARPPFSDTLRSIAGERPLGWALPAVAALTLLAGWTAWFLLAPLPVVVESVDAEVRGPRTVLAAPVDAPVKAVRTRVGDTVEAGAVLVELDPREAEEARARAAATVAGLRARLASLDGLDGAGARTAAVGEAQALAAEARAAAAAAREEAQAAEADLAALRRLSDRGAVGAKEVEDAGARVAVLRAASEAAGQAAAAAALRVEVVGNAQSGTEEQRIRLQADLAAAEVAFAEAEARVARHVLVAPVAGTLVDLASVVPGQWVPTGTPLATLARGDAVEVVAHFAPADAVGRLAPGQPARLSLHSRPWSWYGRTPLRLVAAAQEADASGVRVVFGVEGPDAELVHGMTGWVEVEVERTVPAALVVRSLGRGR